jgi:hypothetical protein
MPLSFSTIFCTIIYVIFTLPDVEGRIICLEQCIRRWAEEKDSVHIANAGKYLSAMAAVALKITYSKNSGAGWLAMFFIASTIATIYHVYWDTVIDWGLLRRDSKNKWLRDELLIKHKWIYFASMVLHHFLAPQLRIGNFPGCASCFP